MDKIISNDEFRSPTPKFSPHYSTFPFSPQVIKEEDNDVSGNAGGGGSGGDRLRNLLTNSPQQPQPGTPQQQQSLVRQENKILKGKWK